MKPSPESAHHGRRSTSITRWAFAFAMTASPALAGNTDTFYLGNDAAMFAGAAAATVTGASAAWYNPARISTDPAESIDIGATAYLLRFGGNPDLEAAPGVPFSRERLSTLDFNAVPTALALKRRVLGLDVALGVFVPTRQVAYPRTLVRTHPTDESRPIALAIDSNERVTEYYAGLGIGRNIAPGLALGFSIFGYHSAEVITTGIAATLADDFFIQHATFDRLRFGVQAVSGLAWNVAANVQLGFVFRTPVVQVLDQTQSASLSGGKSGTETPSELRFEEQALRASPSLLTPARAEFGLAIQPTPKWTVAADLRLRGPLGSGSAAVAVPVANVRAGVRYQIARSVAVGGGAFTDRSPEPRNLTSFRSVVDFYGGTLSLELGSRYRATRTSEAPSRLLFSTILSLSYGYGVGSLGNVQIIPTRDSFDLEPRRDDVTVHELMFHVGSSFASKYLP